MATETTYPAGILNLAEAMDNMDGDVELLQEIVEIFMETADPQIEGLAQLIAGGDVEQVAIQTHAMKGGASNFCAAAFVAAALRLEKLGKSGTLDGAEALLADMQARLAELKDVVPSVNWGEVAAAWRG